MVFVPSYGLSGQRVLHDLLFRRLHQVYHQPETRRIRPSRLRIKIKGGSAVRCSEALKPWGCKASAQHPRQTWAKPEKVGEADRIAMTKQEIYKSEQSNDKDIVLYPEGKFYKAYKRSAWRLCMLGHEFKVSCR